MLQTPTDATLAWAAALIDPPRAERLVAPGDAVDVRALLARLQKNKVPLLSLAGPLVVRLQAAGPEWDAALAAERAEFDAQRAEFERVSAGLAALDVPNLFIKSVGRPPSLPFLSDNLDLLVPMGKAPLARRCLLELGYVEVRNVEEPYKFLFRRFVAGRSVCAVHLHERVGWGTGFMDEEALWGRARPAPDDPLLAIPGPGDGLLIALAHSFYEDKRFNLGDLQRVLWSLRREALVWPEVLAVARQRGWYAGLLTCAQLLAHAERGLYGDTLWPADVLQLGERDLPGWARRGNGRILAEPWARPSWKVSFAYSKRHFFAKLAADRTLSVWRRTADGMEHLWAAVERRLGLRPHHGFLVALSGIDGSGKTAHAEALVAACRTCELQARRSWSRLASSPLMDRALALARKVRGRGLPTMEGPANAGSTLTLALPLRRGREDNTERAPRDGFPPPPQGEGQGEGGFRTTEPAPNPPAPDPAARLLAKRRQLRSPLARAGFVWLTALDLWLSNLRRVAWPLLRGQVVVADRYVLDAAAELGQILDHPAPGRLAAMRLLRALSPRPHVSFLLDVPPDVAARRAEGAEAVQLLATQAALRRDLARSWGVQIVANDGPFEVVSERIVREALSLYYRE